MSIFRPLVAGIVVFAVGCGGPSEKVFRPLDADSVVFWDRQVTDTAELLRQIAAEFNQTHPTLPVKPEYIGGYSEIFRKVTAGIEAGQLPAMAVSYESMTASYVQAGAVLALDPFVNDPELGFTKEDLDDFFPAVIETNRYPQFDHKMYSFPFTKSVLMMYFNKNVLREAGFSAPPRTWDEFLHQCREIKAKTGKYAHAVSVDASTVDGMIFSMGGQVVDGSTTRFDAPEAIKVFELFETLAKEELAYQITPGTYDDESAFAQDEIAFVFRSSSGKTNVTKLMQGDLTRWGMAMIPQADPDHPKTVLYGPNTCIFKTTPEQEKVAWQFIKHFTSPEVSVRWALGSGYVPIRKSAANHPDIQKFWSEWEYNRAAFDCLAFAQSEPNLVGWQKVRDLVDNAQSAVLSKLKSGREAALELKRKADAALRTP